MRPPQPFRFQGEHLKVEVAHGTVLFSTRRGGLSTGPYSSLNLGAIAPRPGQMGEGDDLETVAGNRRLLAEQIGIAPERVAHGLQVHGSVVRRVTEPLSGAWVRPYGPRGTAGLPQADGQATALPGVAAAVLVADCLPVALLADGAVAMLHCGWRGLHSSIIIEGLAALRELGAHGPVTAVIGPGVRGCCYQVGPDVREAFSSYQSHVFREDRLDLASVAAAQLAEEGVQEILDAEMCTICTDRSLFFSHRRDHGVTGRQAGVVWRS